MVDKLVIKHSAAVQVANAINLFQRKAWNVLLANAYDRLLKQDEFEVSIDELAEVVGFESKNIRYLIENIKSLIGCVVEWDMIDKTGLWESYSLLSGAKILPGNILQYSYHKDLKKKLYNPSMYAKISLSMQKRFSSKYTLALYELCVNFFIAKYGKGETPWIDVEDYKKLMNVDGDKYYLEFKNINRRLINGPIEEINNKSDLYVESLYRRKQRKVTDIKFKIKTNPSANNLLEKLQLVNEAAKQRELPLEAAGDTLAIQERLEEYGLVERQVKEILQKHDIQYITEVLDMVDIKILADKISNVAAYTYKAIQEDYRPKKSLQEKLREDHKKAAENLSQIMENQEKLKLVIERDYYDYKAKMVADYIKTLDEAGKNNLGKNFIKKLEKFEKDQYIGKYKEDAQNLYGIIQSSPALAAKLNTYVSDTYLHDKIESLEVFSDKYLLE